MAFDILSDIKPLLTSITTDIYGEFPSDKDNCIAISPSGGFNPEHMFSGGDVSLQKPAITHPSFQITIRNMSAHIMHGWIDAIINALDGKTNYTVDGRTYLMIEQQGDVIPMGRDNNRRHIEAINFNTSIINTR
jgi:hypothetical protein